MPVAIDGNVRQRRWPDWMIVILLFLGPLPMLIRMGQFLWGREQYQFFPLIIVGAGALAFEHIRENCPPPAWVGGPRWVSAALLAMAMGLLVVSGLIWVQALAGLAMILILAAIAWWRGGKPLLRAIGPALVLLLTILPPPVRRDQQITLQLQQLAVGISSQLLDHLHIAHVQTGNVLEIPGRRLLVQQACSGINSLMAVLAFTLLYGFWKQRPMMWVVILLPFAGLFVLWGNIARITIETWLKVSFNIDWLEGPKHELLGLVLFIGCAVLVVSFDHLIRLLVTLFYRSNSEIDVQALTARKVTPAAGRTIKPAWPEWATSFLFALTGLWMTTRVWNAWTSPAIHRHAFFQLPDKIGEWEKVAKAATLVERPQTEAATSFVWQYHHGDLIASAAIDYPFTGYHELSICYESTGWHVSPQATIQDRSGNFQKIDLSKPQQHGALFFSLSDEQGQSIASVPPFTYWSISNSLIAYRSFALGGPSYQTQVMIQRYSELTPEQNEQVKQLFLQSRQLLLSQLRAQLTRN